MVLPPFDPWRSGAVALDVAATTWGSRRGVLDRQQRRLAALLAGAAAHCPAYRERLGRSGAGARPPLHEIAPVTKAELMGRFDEWLTDPRLRREDLLRFAADPARIGESCGEGRLLWTSSGSSGEPALFVQDARAMAVYDALEFLRRPRLRSSPDWWDPRGLVHRLAFVGATGGHFAATVSLERLRRLVPALSNTLRGFDFLAPADVLSSELERFAPTVLFSYPTMALLLASRVREGGLAIRPQEIWTGGETLTAPVRREIEAAFGCRVGNGYGASEFLALATECPLGRLHLNEDWVVLEPVDEHHVPVPAGVAGHTTLLTNLANHLQPLIRYDLGDRVTLAPHACPCGSPLATLEVEGRSDEVLCLLDDRQRGVPLPPLALTTVLEDEAGVFDFQLEQTGERALELRIAAGGEAGQAVLATACAALGAYLARQGLGGVRLHGVCGEPARRGDSGKLLRILGPRGPGSDAAGEPA